MGLFDQVVSALNNPNQQANTNQIGGILGTVQQLASQQNMDTRTTQTLISVLGQHVRTALQEKRSTQGDSQVENIVNQYSGTQASAEAVQSIFTPEQEQRTVADSTQATGLNAQTIQSLLPLLIPVVLNLLQTGASKQPGQGRNSVLSAFLDADQDGDTDIGDAISIAGQFMQSRRGNS